MKKNQKTYLLLAVVIGIWGIIGFKLLNAANPKPNATAEIVSNEAFVPKLIKQRDTFSIVANYRDPFLGTVHAPKKKVKKKTAAKKAKPKVPERAIAYTGLITDKGTGQKIFFVTVDGQQQMLSVNDTFEGVELTYGNKDKIKVRHDGRTRTITLAQ